MEGTIFLEILRDLQREGWKDAGRGPGDEHEGARRSVEPSSRIRSAARCRGIPPDRKRSTRWTKYFGNTQKAQVTLDAILAYMPTVPHWGYNGSARRYWDFLYAAQGAARRDGNCTITDRA